MSEQYVCGCWVCPAWTLKPCLAHLHPERIAQLIQRVNQCVACAYSPNGYDCNLSEPEVSVAPVKDLRRRVNMKTPLEAIV